MFVKTIIYGSSEYRRAVELRERVLRVPLGLVFTPADLATDADDTHLGLFDADELVGCLSLARLGPGRAKIRQVAVDPARQGAGIGRRLMVEVEALARTGGIREVELNARHSALGFYEALGFRGVGASFNVVGLPHLRMTKILT